MAWRRGQQYSQDLRERILSSVDGGTPVYRVAKLFRVSVSYIYKALIGCVAPVTAARTRTGAIGRASSITSS